MKEKLLNILEQIPTGVAVAILLVLAVFIVWFIRDRVKLWKALAHYAREYVRYKGEEHKLRNALAKVDYVLSGWKVRDYLQEKTVIATAPWFLGLVIAVLSGIIWFGFWISGNSYNFETSFIGDIVMSALDFCLHTLTKVGLIFMWFWLWNHISIFVALSATFIALFNLGEWVLDFGSWMPYDFWVGGKELMAYCALFTTIPAVVSLGIKFLRFAHSFLIGFGCAIRARFRAGIWGNKDYTEEWYRRVISTY